MMDAREGVDLSSGVYSPYGEWEIKFIPTDPSGPKPTALRCVGRGAYINRDDWQPMKERIEEIEGYAKIDPASMAAIEAKRKEYRWKCFLFMIQRFDTVMFDPSSLTK